MSKIFRIIMPVGVLILFFYYCDGTCELCTYTNQTTTHSKCSETCGGGERYYFQYVCCANFTKPECERECNISLTLTKSVQIFESCNKNCSKGGTYNDTTKRCDCPEGTGGRCCNQYPPKVYKLSQQYMIEGRDLSITCQATPGNPNSTTFYWTKVDNPGLRQNGSTLQLYNIQRTSSGTYICTAENSHNNGEKGTHSQPLDVHVQYPPKVDGLSQQDIIEGRDLSVTCQATPGNPNSTTFYWTKEDDTEFRQNGSTLQLYNIQRNSSGTYRCTAENSYHNGEKGIHSQPLDVNVQYPPTVNTLSQQDIMEGRYLSVTCQATPGNPSSTTFYWTKVDNPGFKQNGSTLQLYNIQRNSSGTYICTAENSYHNGEKGIHSQPLDVNVQYANRSIGKRSPYLTVGLPLGLFLLLAILVVIVYGWCMNRRRNLRVDVINTESGEEVHVYNNI